MSENSSSAHLTNYQQHDLFPWVSFYQAFAKALLKYRYDRTPLITHLHSLAQRIPVITNLQDQFLNGSRGPLQDICPFTVMGTFNRGITPANRHLIASELAKFLEVAEPVPDNYQGIPILNNQRSWLFGFATHRKISDIDTLWNIFEQAINLVEDPKAQKSQKLFITSYNQATQVYTTGWNLTIGLFWLNANFYPTLDSYSRIYIKSQLNILIPAETTSKRLSGEDYLQLKTKLDDYFQLPNALVKSFPELSYHAWANQDKKLEQVSLANDQTKTITPLELNSYLEQKVEPYTLDSIVEEGCFLEKAQLQKILQRLMEKKNIILQGAPGTGKTWLAKRLAFALIGSRSPEQLKALQFHPNLSYEDFVRGWRPNGEGKLILVDGPILTIAKAAQQNPNDKYVLVIEEINRGNPAHLFGDLLTLLEADKHNIYEALELSYRHKPDEKIYLPPNLYVVGTMNLADRSLALMDLALRRRFAFIDLQPEFTQRWHDWLVSEHHFEASQTQSIAQAIQTLNQTLAQDNTLGTAFQIGHSYFTPRAGYTIENVKNWYEEVIETEILPLLQEYWFDAPEKIQQARKKLLGIF